MSKRKMAKRIIALIAIVTLFAAMTITASAASYESTTMYVGNDTVKVTTYVTGLTKGDEVTYYAENSESKEVYINQYTANGATMSKDYVADLEDVSGLDIKMAKVSSVFDSPETIESASETNVVSYVLNGEVVYSNAEAPEVEEIIETLVPVVDENGKMISAMTATYNGETEDVSVFVTGTTVSIVNPFDFSEAEGIIGVDLTAGYEYDGAAAYGFNYVGKYCEPEYELTDEEGSVTGTMISVLYDAVIPVDAKEVGIKVSMVNGEALGEEEFLAAAGVLGSTTPKFAIALVEKGLTSFGYTPYYIDAEDNTVCGDYKAVNAIVKSVE